MLNDSVTERASHVQGHAGSPGNRAWKQLVLQICNLVLATGTELRGIHRQISSLGNVMPGLSLWENAYWHQDGVCKIDFLGS